MNPPANSTHTVTGKRPVNEDRYLAATLEHLYIFGVFDGHGGSEAAELAQQTFMTEFAQQYQSQSLTTALRLTFEELDAHITDQNVESGTTATIAVVDKDLLTIAHVGDSKAVLVSDGQAVFETKPHVLTDPSELAIYRSSNWFKTKSKLVSQGKLKGFKLSAVSRSLGDTFFEDALSATPDVTEHKILSGDSLLIATDGLWNFVATQTVLETVSGSSNQEGVSKELVELALRSGSTDNVSVVTIRW